jgi:hypothetical protein
MKKGIHYTETYAPIATWNSIRLLLTLTAVHRWHTKTMDYVLAYTQAPVEKDLYMKSQRDLKLIRDAPMTMY